MKTAKVGDRIRPIPLWNASTQYCKLPAQAEVLAVIPARSQSGILYRVRSVNGVEMDLDAAWFEP